MKNVDKLQHPLKPPALKKGDTIGLFAPAGPIPGGEILSKGCQLLEEFGFKVKYGSDISQQTNYLAGSDERRVQEFQTLWQDPEVKALLAVRGGYGSIRIMADLDIAEISQHPKLIIGFSDLTVLLNGLQSVTSLVTLHGPMLSTMVRDGRVSAHKFLEGLTTIGRDEITPANLQILRTGECTGRLMGGNLTNLVHLIGTPFEPDWGDTILFVEDINETAYKIDRMLTHLKLATRLDKVAGIILGGFLAEGNEPINDIELIHQRVLELTDEHIPVWAGFPVSHGSENIIMPLGVQARMNSKDGVLYIEEEFFDHMAD